MCFEGRDNRMWSLYVHRGKKKEVIKDKKGLFLA